MAFALWCVAAYIFTFIHFYAGAKLSIAEKGLQKNKAGWWAGFIEALGWIDFFMAVGISWWLAVPAVLGAITGERWSVGQDFVRERIRKRGQLEKRRQRRLARMSASMPAPESLALTGQGPVEPIAVPTGE